MVGTQRVTWKVAQIVLLLQVWLHAVCIRSSVLNYYDQRLMNSNPDM